MGKKKNNIIDKNNQPNDLIDNDEFDISEDLEDLDELKELVILKGLEKLDIESESDESIDLEELDDLDSDSDSDSESKSKLIKKKQLFTNEYDNIDIDDFDKYNDLIEMIYEKNNINIKEEKRRFYCGNCNDDDVVEDTSQGIIVCKSCGEVISTLMDTNAEWTQYNDDNKKETIRSSHTVSALLPQSSTSTNIAGSCSSRMKTIHKWTVMPYKERSLNDVFKIIHGKCVEGRILKCIEDDAKIMYKNISDCKHISGKNNGKPIIIRGKNRISVIAGCILYACRKKNKTRSPKEIAELFGLRYTEITKGCKIFQKLAKLKEIDYKFTFTKPEHFITRFCEELKIKNDFIIQAIQISNNVQKLQIASVHTPLSLATGSIYMMIHLNGLNIQKKSIADKFNVSQVTIAKAFKKIEPFVNILTNDRICEKLSVEIKNYQDDIDILEVLKPKFLRFNIDIEKTMGRPAHKIYSLIDINNNNELVINNKLIVEHNIEFNNKDKQIDNEFFILNQNYAELKFQTLSILHS